MKQYRTMTKHSNSRTGQHRTVVKQGILDECMKYNVGTTQPNDKTMKCNGRTVHYKDWTKQNAALVLHLLVLI